MTELLDKAHLAASAGKPEAAIPLILNALAMISTGVGQAMRDGEIAKNVTMGSNKFVKDLDEKVREDINELKFRVSKLEGTV